MPEATTGLTGVRAVAFACIAGVAACAGLYLTSLYSYDLFHSLVEIFGVVVAVAIFIVAWNTRRFLANRYLLCLGVAYLFVGVADVLHTLSYQGMNVFTGYGNDLPTQLWLAARFLQAFALFLAPLLMSRRLDVRFYLGIFGGLTAVLLALIFFKVFPAAFIDGRGLTPFKIGSEYAISAVLLAGFFLLVWRRTFFERSVFLLLGASILVTIVSELMFTFYRSPFGLPNLAGHLLKVVAFYLAYKAVVATALTRPYVLLFRELKQSEEALRKSEEFQRSIADVLQEAMLAVPEGMPGIKMGHLYHSATEAARVGGDFLDVFAVGAGSIGLLIGDVSGSGLRAAALTSLVKDTIKAYGYEGVSPAVAMEKTNLVLTRAANAGSRGETQFVTAFYGVLDTATGRLTYSVSGHPPGIVRHNSETVFLSGCSPVLGVFETVGFQDGETHLGPGDLLVLYTDGLTEARSQGEFFGEQRLLSLVATMGDRPVSEVPQAIFTGALEFTGGNFSDDVAILAVALE